MILKFPLIIPRLKPWFSREFPQNWGHRNGVLNIRVMELGGRDSQISEKKHPQNLALMISYRYQTIKNDPCVDCKDTLW